MLKAEIRGLGMPCERLREVRTAAARVARRAACAAGLTGLGLAGAAGAWRELPLERMWVSMLWCGAAALILGWAIGHAAGRLRCEARAQARAAAPCAGASTGEIAQQEHGASKGA